MNNPNGPYPGRQLFLGLTDKSNPCFGYLVTGRSPESRERRAIPVENVIRIGPLGDVAYDPLRHYSAVKYDPLSGVLAVTNGIQTEAIFEAYKLLANTGGIPAPDYMEKLLEGAGAEPDSYHTPRIAGVITLDQEKTAVLIIGMKGFDFPAKAWKIAVKPGQITGISTYRGSLSNPEARTPSDNLPTLDFVGGTASELADLLFDMSRTEYNGKDIRVGAVGGMLVSEIWELAVRNANR